MHGRAQKEEEERRCGEERDPEAGADAGLEDEEGREDDVKVGGDDGDEHRQRGQREDADAALLHLHHLRISTSPSCQSLRIVHLSHLSQSGTGSRCLTPQPFQNNSFQL